jgi:S-adenosylmethionine hydrolase
MINQIVSSAIPQTPDPVCNIRVNACLFVVFWLLFALFAMSAHAGSSEDRHPLVLLSDFGLTERFVASMKGVAMDVDPHLSIHDLSHQVEPFNVWQASYLLAGTIGYWPRGTVFVSVVDPGVGTARRSVVAKTRSGHFVVTPDNGSLTLVEDSLGVEALRRIDEKVNRRPGSEQSHTFHGRDVYAYTGARLAAGVIDFEAVGPALELAIVRLEYQRPELIKPDTVAGNIRHIEFPFGNVVTNIPKSMFDKLSIRPENALTVNVEITRNGQTIFQKQIPYVPSFGFVSKGQPLLYSDSLQIIGLAVNSGSFATQFGIRAGPEWNIKISTRTFPDDE